MDQEARILDSPNCVKADFLITDFE